AFDRRIFEQWGKVLAAEPKQNGGAVHFSCREASETPRQRCEASCKRRDSPRSTLPSFPPATRSGFPVERADAKPHQGASKGMKYLFAVLAWGLYAGTFAQQSSGHLKEAVRLFYRRHTGN